MVSSVGVATCRSKYMHVSTMMRIMSGLRTSSKYTRTTSMKPYSETVAALWAHHRPRGCCTSLCPLPGSVTVIQPRRNAVHRRRPRRSHAARRSRSALAPLFSKPLPPTHDSDRRKNISSFSHIVATTVLAAVAVAVADADADAIARLDPQTSRSTAQTASAHRLLLVLLRTTTPIIPPHATPHACGPPQRRNPAVVTAQATCRTCATSTYQRMARPIQKPAAFTICSSLWSR